MKNTLFALLILLSLPAQGQNTMTVYPYNDTNGTGLQIVHIAPTKWNYNDTVRAYYLASSVDGSNKFSYMRWRYTLLDSCKNRITTGLLLMSGQDFIDYRTALGEGELDHDFNWIADKLNLQIIQ